MVGCNKVELRQRKYTKEFLQDLVENSHCVADILRKIGKPNSGGMHSFISRRIKEYGIDTPNFSPRPLIYNINHKKKPLRKILKKNSSFSRTHLKRRLIEEEIIKNKCDECGLEKSWKGKSINMVLDHINGVNNDNRLKNLRLLCPNCNSQQETFCARNSKVQTRKCTGCGKRIGKTNKTGKCFNCLHYNK